MFINTHREEIYIYPQTTMGWVAWMSCSRPDAWSWCHRMKLKSKGCEQVAVVLAVIIIYSSKF